MTPKEAIELIEYELPFTSGIIEEALETIRICVDKQTPNLDLINHQKAEMERLKAELKELDKPNCSLEDVQQEEREQSKYFNLAVECARDKAIKEFARLIIDKSQDGVIRAADIPDLAREMTEVQE